jgi:hypothetical protein
VNKGTLIITTQAITAFELAKYADELGDELVNKASIMELKERLFGSPDNPANSLEELLSGIGVQVFKIEF